MKPFIAAIILSLLSVTANAAVIDKPLGDIYNMVQAGEVCQLIIDGVPVEGAGYSDQMEAISTQLGIAIYASTDTDTVLWFAPVNGAGSVISRLK